MTEDELKCLSCGEVLEENDEGLLECMGCGEEFKPTSEKGFLQYGQAGVEGFSYDTVEDLARDMADDGCEHVTDLYIDRRQLGTGAIEILPTKATVKALESALEWVKTRIAKEVEEGK